jgi:integrase
MAGQIIKRGENVWQVRISLGRDPNTGTRRYHNHTIRGTKKDAQKYLNGILRDIDMGTFVEPSGKTLDQYLNDWLETSAKSRIGENTFRTYTDYLKRYVRPTLGAYKLSSIQPLNIQELYTQMQDDGLSARTVRYAHAILSSALKQAVKWRLLQVNPASFVDLPRQKRQEMQVLTPKQVGLFLKATDGDRYAVLFAFALATGMRPSEYLALQWKDVDLKAGTVIVQRSLVRLNKEWKFAETKTARSRRTIPLPKTVTRQLKSHKQRQAAERLKAGSGYNNNDLVFATQSGLPVNLHNLLHQNFKPILVKAKLPKIIRLYDLRHTCATLLMGAGENPKVVSERLGHASIALTLDVYSHVLPTMQEKAAERLELAMFGRS